MNSREETMGQKEGGEREQVIACTMIEYAYAATGEKMASICQRCGGWGTLAMRSLEFHT